MIAAVKPELPAVAVWDRVLKIDSTISLTAARALLKLNFTQSDVDRMQALAAQARNGELSEADELEIDAFERMGCLLDILHSKSRRVLLRRKATV